MTDEQFLALELWVHAVALTYSQKTDDAVRLLDRRRAEAKALFVSTPIKPEQGEA